MSIRRTVLALISLGIVVVTARLIPLARTPRKPERLVTISAATTRITEPLRADGYVDYFAALNQHLSQGVTQDNNSAVPMIQAVGPGVLPEQIRQKYFQMLGVPPLPDEGPYFVPFLEYAKRVRGPEASDTTTSDEDWRPTWDELDRALIQPWSAAELPTVAAWLDANEQPLARIVEASNRPRRYDPLIASGESAMLLTVLLPTDQAHREGARALVARAMRRLADGQTDDAWHDALACHRLSRLMGQGATLIDMLVALNVDGIACAADQAIVAHGSLTACQARAMHDEFQRLPPLPRAADVIDLGERYSFLDSVQAMAALGPGALSRVAGGDGEGASALGEFFSGVGARAIDWDLILRMGNSWYDRLVAAQRRSTWGERSAAMEQFEGELRELNTAARDLWSLLPKLVLNRRGTVSEQIGQILVSLILPAHGVAVEAEERAAANTELVKLDFLLAAYRAEHGAYPSELSALVPEYTAEIPRDRFTDQPLIYKHQEGGYLLYSVGVNGKDDGGLSYQDRAQSAEANADCDDLVIRIPPKTPE